MDLFGLEVAICAQFFRAVVEEERSHPSKMVERDSSAAVEDSFRVTKDHHSLRLLLFGNTSLLALCVSAVFGSL